MRTFANHKKIKNLHSDESSANVFGLSGILSIPRKHAFELPVINAIDCQGMLYDKFGIIVIPPMTPLPKIKAKGQKLYMVSYQINSHFASDYIHRLDGPGIFLEHHKFPHYMTAVSKDSRGPVVGKFDKDNNLELIGLNIQLGYTIYLPEYTIHNDWYFIGKIATTVMVDEEADTVFIRGFHNKKLAMNFLYKPFEK